MPKPVFNPVQYELRNELPTVVSAEQLAQIAQATDRVNVQLNWVAQLLGWSGPNYWTNLPSTVSEKRALLGGTFGVYNSYTLLRLKEVQSWKPALITEKKPNIAIGQRVIVGDQQAYIYDLLEGEDHLELNIGPITSEILSLLEQGAAIRVDCKENRPFPFYRPEALASGDADFRCSIGRLTRSTPFYKYYELILSPFSQEGILLNYENLELYGGSYYYFDRAVYLTVSSTILAPWIECQWVESKGLWQMYVPPEAVGNALNIVWDYAQEGSRAIATAEVQIIAWSDPSDWGNGGQGFNPVLDAYFIEKSYDVAGLNFSLGTYLHLGDSTPLTDNPLWFDAAGGGTLYSQLNGDWIETGRGVAFLSLQDDSAPPPYTYDIKPGTVWQSPTGRTFIWDSGFQPLELYYIFPTGFKDGFIFTNPSSQNVQGLYLFDPDNFYIHDPNGVTNEGLVFYNCYPDDENFYVNDPFVKQPDWYEIEFFNESLQTTIFAPTYGSYLTVNVDGVPIPNTYGADDYNINWSVRGDYLFISYRALTTEGETFVPSITITSDFQASNQVIDISEDFTPRTEVTSLPYNEAGPLNNFIGVWGNKGGTRALDFVFDALSIHGYNEREALHLEPVEALINYDFMLQQVTGKQCFVGDSPPALASVGDYYWNNETGALAVLYEDNDRNKVWLEINYPIAPCQIGTPDCDYFPLKPILSTGTCAVDNGDLWQDPVTEGVAIFYDDGTYNPAWVEVNWVPGGGAEGGWPFSEYPNPTPDLESINIYITDDFIPVQPGVEFSNDDFIFEFIIEPLLCAYRFKYTAVSERGIQQFPTVWFGVKSLNYPPKQITDEIFSNARFFLAPAVQNATSVLRPWKTQSLEVCTEVTADEELYVNPLIADTNCGPGDENWDRSFIRLPSEYGRGNKVWNKARLAVQDFTYAGTNGSLKEMRCPSYMQKPQIYEEVVFYRRDPSVGTVLYSEPYLYSDVEGFYNLSEYFDQPDIQDGEYALADFDFAFDDQYDEWTEAHLEEYQPLHFRQTVASGDWEGLYVEPTGNRPLSGFLATDLRVRSAVPVAPPVWDASIYKYAPLCQQPPETYAEDPNNCKVGYAYFAADLAAAEDGFFDQQKDVAWRKPLVEDQTLYMLN